VFKTDPCPLTFKRLYIEATGCIAARLKYDVKIPIGSDALVMIPALGLQINTLVIWEGSSILWSQGKYQPGIQGIKDATVTATGIKVSVLSGSFSFTMGGSDS